MIDPRIQTLARNLVGYSCKVQPGEKVLIEAIDIPAEAVCAMIQAVNEKRGIPLVTIKQSAVLRELYRSATEEGMRFTGDVETKRMESVQAYIALRGNHNIAGRCRPGRPAGQPQHRRALRRPRRQDGPL